VRQLRKLLLGETRILPAGVALLVAAVLALDAAGPGWWADDGGFVVLAGALAVLIAAVAGPGPRRPRAGRRDGRGGPS
jgi:peptidoglycan/LPS O-acetylase OafA/YrhL